MKKQLCSLFLCVAMVFSYFTQVMAYDIDFAHAENFIKASVTSEDDLPLLSLEYMTSADGVTFTKATSKPEIGPDITTPTSDTDFYVGVKAEKFSNFALMERGMYSFAIGISYNGDYVVPEADSYRNLFGTYQYDNSQFRTNVSNRIQFTGSPWVVEGNAVAEATSAATIDIANSRLYANIQLSAIGLYAPPVQLDDQYLMFFKFRLKQVPPPGTKLFNFGSVAFGNTTDLVLTYCGSDKAPGSQGTTTALTYNNESTRLDDYLRLDTTDVDDIFPPEYTVTYDAGAGKFAGDAANPTEVVTKNEKLTFIDKTTSADINAMAGAAAPTGYVFNGWATELDTTDNRNMAATGAKVDGDTEINPTNVPTIDENANTLTLYATYTEGYSVTFHADPGSFADSTTSKNIMRKKNEVLLNTGETISGTLGVDDPTLANHTFVDWYLKEGGTFTTLIDDAALIAMGAVDENLDVYPMWNQTVGDLTLTFDNNAPADKLTTSVSPTSVQYNSNSPDTLTSVIGGMPVEPTRNDGYQFLGWFKNQSGDGERLKADTVLSSYTDNGAITTVYARWGYVQPEPDPDNPDPTNDTITVHFVEESNKYSNENGGTYKYTTINDKYVNKTDTAIANMPDPDDMIAPTGKGFGGWATAITSAGAVDPAGKLLTDLLDGTQIGNLTEAATGTLNLYAVWVDEVVLSFDENGAKEATPPSITIVSGKTLDDIGETMPVVTRDGYDFVGWYEDDGAGNPVAAATDENTPITKTMTVKAKWSISIEITPDETSFEYDGTAKTSYYEKTPGSTPRVMSYTVMSGTEDVTDDFPIEAFDLYYARVTGAATTPDYATDPTAYQTAPPTEQGEYDVYLELNATHTDPYITVSKRFVPDLEITGKEIDINLSNLEQYIDDKNDVDDIVATPSVTPMPTGFVNDPFNDPNSDIKIKFTKLDDDGSVSATQPSDPYAMPDDYGTYEVEVEGSDNYDIKNVTPLNSPDGTKTYFYFYPLTRKVMVNYGNGTNKAADQTAPYTTVTMNTGVTGVKSPDAVAVDISGATPKTDLPVAGTDYDPPAGMKVGAWVVLPDGYAGDVTTLTMADTKSAGGALEEFTATYQIPASDKPLNVAAIYVKAEWTINFNDTQATPTSKVTYVVESEKAIEDTEAVKTVDGVVVDHSTTPVNDVPAAQGTAPANKMFYGWYTVDVTGDNTAADIDAMVTAGSIVPIDKAYKLDTDAHGSDVIDVYAVYVLSDDANITAINFKENDALGKSMDNNYAEDPAVAIANSRPEWVKDTAIAFDSDTNEYWLIANNDVADLYAELTLSQPGSTVTSAISTTGSNVIVTPGATGGTFTLRTEKTDGSGVMVDSLDATTYDETSGTNSTNDITITVTAPDGTASQTYTFHVIRYAEARFELNYGNSPYGLIMNMPDWDDAHKKAAKADFISGSSVTRNTFKTDIYTPTGMVAGEGLKYTTIAWGINEATDNENIEKNKENMDRNDYAIFVYQRTDFKDPGFKAINSLGREVDPSTSAADATQYAPVVTREISFRRLAGDGQDIETVADNDEIVTVAGQPSDYLFTEITSKQRSANGAFMHRPVRPDKYTMTYTFVDPYIEDTTRNTITDERAVVVLSILGDATFDMSINAGDLSLINAAEKAGDITVNQASMPMSAWSIFVYRVLDNTSDGSVNAGDASMINTAERTMTNPDIRYYPFLPQS